MPTTTRTREQYLRIRLPGPAPRFAVCANGGHLLVDGVSDPEWHAAVRARLDEECAPLAEVQAHLAAAADPAWLLKHRTADELFAYLVVERALLPGDWVKELAVWAEPRGWTVSLQGRKVYAVPKPLTKSAAVREVARRAGAGRTLAAGDSLLDADLLLAADLAWRPGHGELAEAGWTAPGVTALPERGVAAGERILREFLGAVRRRSPAPEGGPGVRAARPVGAAVEAAGRRSLGARACVNRRPSAARRKIPGQPCRTDPTLTRTLRTPPVLDHFSFVAERRVRSGH